MKSSRPDQYDIVFEAPPGTAEPAPEVKLMLEIVENGGSPALLKVFGVGGGGSNAVNRMIQAGLRDVEFWVSNTDLQALELSACHNRLPIGKNTTRGLGAGGDPEIGRLSAEEDAQEIEQIIDGADMIFITAGMGGGTGTGAAPVIARIARELGVLTVGIVTRPFSFEGKKKAGRARRGLEALAEQVDTLISIPNDKLMQIVAPGTSFDDALLMADDVLLQATRGISDLIMGHGIINLDFADVRTVMRGRGNALLGSGTATGERRALEAAEKAVSSPLLEDLAIAGAEAVLVNIQGGPSMGFHEAAQAAQFVSDQVGEEADVFWGAVVDPNMGEEMRVTLVATGFPESRGQQTITVQTGADLGAREATNGHGPGAGIRRDEPSDFVLDDVVARPEQGGRRESPLGDRVHAAQHDPHPVRGEVREGSSRDVRAPGLDPDDSGFRDRGRHSGDLDGRRGENGQAAGGAPRHGTSRGGQSEDPRADSPEGARFERERRQVEEARAASLGRPVESHDRRGGDRGPLPEDRGQTEADRRGRPAEGSRLPERQRRGPADSVALGASGLESELFLPKDREAGSDPGLRRSRWASADPEWTEGDDPDASARTRRPLDVPAYLRRRMD